MSVESRKEKEYNKRSVSSGPPAEEQPVTRGFTGALPPPPVEPAFEEPNAETIVESDITGTEYDAVSGLPVAPELPADALPAPGTTPLQSPVQAGNLPDGAAPAVFATVFASSLRSLYM